MLTPEYIKDLPSDIVKLYEKLEIDIIKDVSRRISEDIKLTATADYQISQLKLMGYDMTDISNAIAETGNIAINDVEELLKKSSYLSHENDQVLYANGGKELPDMSHGMKQQIEATIKLTQNDLSNITQSMANGYQKQGAFVKQYRDTLNYASIQLASGTVTQNQAIKNAVQSLMDSGMTKVKYKSGATANVDVAVRRAVLTNSTKISGAISLQNAIDMGQDLMEISSHIGARPSHADWQGEIVSRSGTSGYLSLTDIGYEDVTGFKGVNCAHDWYPFFDGIDQPIDKVVEPDPIEYNGREYTDYEASQKQRYHERNIRETKREVEALKSAGLTDEAKMAQIKLNRQQAEYKKFSEAMGIRPKTERTGITTGRVSSIDSTPKVPNVKHTVRQGSKND